MNILKRFLAAFVLTIAMATFAPLALSADPLGNINADTVEVSTFQQLYDAINTAPTNGQIRTIRIMSPVIDMERGISIDGGRNISLVAGASDVILNAAAYGHFGVRAYSTLTLGFRNTGGEITLTTNRTTGLSGGIIIFPNGTFVMNSGSITGNIVDSDVAGVVAFSRGRFVMNGGSITSNHITGGGVLDVMIDPLAHFHREPSATILEPSTTIGNLWISSSHMPVFVDPPEITITQGSGTTAIPSPPVATSNVTPLIFSIVPLVHGIEIHPYTGGIRAPYFTPPGVYNVNVRVTNAAGTTTQAMTVNVTAAAAAAFVPVTGIAGVPTSITAGTTAVALPVLASPNNATNRDVTWEIYNAGTTGATRTGNTITAPNPGTLVVRATVVNGQTATTNFHQNFTITVNPVTPGFVPVTNITGVDISPITAGQTRNLSGTVTPSNATNQTIVWSIHDCTFSTVTGATITSGNVLNIPAGAVSGYVCVYAIIVNGLTPTETFTRPFLIPVNAISAQTHEMTITNAPAIATAPTGQTTSGARTVGASVSINAGDRTGYTFAGWTATPAAGVTFADASSISTTFTMPDNAVTITANWTNVPSYTATITNNPAGAASSGQSVTQLRVVGSTVTLAAGIREGFTFSGWTSNDVTITSPNNATNATFVMPSHDITITANWTAVTAGLFNVHVFGSTAAVTGAGLYAPGATVTVRTYARPDLTFFGWTSWSNWSAPWDWNWNWQNNPDWWNWYWHQNPGWGFGVEFVNPLALTTTFVMPAHDVFIEANWSPIGDWWWQMNRPSHHAMPTQVVPVIPALPPIPPAQRRLPGPTHTPDPTWPAPVIPTRID
ncbi:MAG: hypothetical protein FWC67_00355 [Defluviitaleaceae bacterium]|nr:hypothetical protein [Defluviitaleaceae bacterium]